MTLRALRPGQITPARQADRPLSRDLCDPAQNRYRYTTA
ncbi:protein of unknown function [Cupriavidus neocaledonicus]|uniref:Uncharacterized protein n=1 Tax=Cupriavidus neocaledonicus TaxID=1040979 RepID=A0A375HDP7_9BURK|nr:protein of unknown function [Cupriavidus neocaledonicus]